MPDERPIKIGADQSNLLHHGVTLPGASGLRQSGNASGCLDEIRIRDRGWRPARGHRAPTVKKLTEAQKAELAEIDNLYESRIAERRVFLEGEIPKAERG